MADKLSQRKLLGIFRATFTTRVITTLVKSTVLCPHHRFEAHDLLI